MPVPHPTSAASTGQPADPAVTAFVLGMLFVPAMFVFFTLGLGHLIDYIRVAGWMKPMSEKHRQLRVDVLGEKTARCEKCLADCRRSIGTWVVDGLCEKCRRSDR